MATKKTQHFQLYFLNINKGKKSLKLIYLTYNAIKNINNYMIIYRLAKKIIGKFDYITDTINQPNFVPVHIYCRRTVGNLSAPTIYLSINQKYLHLDFRGY